jgi:hypothetical protein
MAMPLCGTFHYVAAVPDGFEKSRTPIRARDESGPTDSRYPDPLLGSRLVGFAPNIEIRGHRIVITASSRERAEVSAASFAMDPELIEMLRGGDVIRVVREKTGDVGVAVLRDERLMVAFGAVSALPLGPEVSVGVEPAEAAEYVAVRVGSETALLAQGEPVQMGDYELQVVRPTVDGIPGHCESVAVCRAGACSLNAAVRSAELLEVGLGMVRWDPVRPERSILLQVFVPEERDRSYLRLGYHA